MISRMLNTKLFYVFLTVILFTVDTQHKLSIQSPPELVKIIKDKHPDGIPFSIANYGDVPFGTTLSGTIFLPVILENCRKQSLIDTNADKKINKIVMSSRGDCSFTTKSLISQHQGAKMAIIADNIASEDPGRIILVDDGRGPQVKIPTIFIQQELGDLIQNYIIEKGQQVAILFKFDTNLKPFADISLWMSSFDRHSYNLIRSLEPYLSRINERISIKLYHPTSVCRTCLQTDCYGDKKYCINTGYFGIAIPNFGQLIIREQLREQLIIQKYCSSQKNCSIWWKYMQTYDDECDTDAYMEQCAVESMKKVGINDKIALEIQKQIEKSFQKLNVTNPDTNQTKEIVNNQILEKNYELKKKAGLVVYPTIIVNNITYRGNLEALDVFEMICNSLIQQPEGCSFNTETPATPWNIIIPIIIIFLIFMIFLVGCYRRKVRRQLSKGINKQVNQLVNQYITMYEASKFDSQEK